ncbi:MAG TPA: MarR family transcriptional regulator [Gammaproteobacteria bacterium]|nr:MarR family transcriptional regulator [Gammaproteobacteria bacterium]
MTRKSGRDGNIDYQTLVAFRSALRRFLRISEEIASGLGLTPQQHQMMLVIRGYSGEGHPTIGALAKRLQVRHNSAVGLINRLARLGFVKRVPGKRDRRQVQVLFTGNGLAMLEKLTLAHHAELKQIGPEIRKLLTILQRQWEQ